MPPQLRNEFRSFLKETEERRQGLFVDSDQPMLFSQREIPRKVGRHYPDWR